MDKTIEKFLEFLKNYSSLLEDKLRNLISKTEKIKVGNNYRFMRVNNTSNTINLSFLYDDSKDLEKEEYIKLLGEVEYLNLIFSDGFKVFADFDILSKFLLESKLNVKECLGIISYIIDLNIKELEVEDKDDEPAIVSYKKIGYLSDDERKVLRKFMDDTENKTKYTIIDFEKLSMQEQAEICDISEKIIVDNPDDFKEALFDFKMFYLDKNNTFDLNDVDVIENALCVLSVDNNMISKIRVYLEKEIQKRNKKQEVVVIPKRKEFKSNLLTDKEYKKLKKELYSYYDLYNRQAIRELTEDEKLRVIYLILKMGESLTDVGNFLRLFKLDYKDYVKSNINLINNGNGIEIYLRLYEKLKFYEKRLNITSNLKYIEECFKEIFICNDEDYIFYKNEIENELLKILNILPQDYDYEVSEISKRIKLERS